MNLVSLGNLHEIRIITQIRLGIVALVEQLLPLPHHAQIFVVHDHQLDGQSKPVYGGQFLNIHLESAVAGNAQHASFRLRQLHSHRRRQSKTHRTQPARSNEASRRRRLIPLRRPHLVLAHVRNHHAVLR